MTSEHGRIPLVAGNWKMNTTVPEGIDLARAIMAIDRPDGVEVAILPPFTHLWPVRDVLGDAEVGLGAQDCFWETSGAYTGEMSPRTLAQLCDMVLVGHSERRHIIGETDEQTARKLRAALGEGLDVILAVGELLAERRAGEAESVVERQLTAALAGLDEASLGHVVIAYEPVWAIGTGECATPDDAQSMSAFIRSHVERLVSGAAGRRMRILYGGSVTADNAASLFEQPDVDGGLIGGASLKAEVFARIIEAASSTAASAGRV
ncbi:MAG TPA: triose-phosphate isomerase [Candidatus Dormibacteraeota bacterium]|nr:triose-phosphate isomerase [Candidatus Dormibacteraeota bacterium]